MCRLSDASAILDNPANRASAVIASRRVNFVTTKSYDHTGGTICAMVNDKLRRELLEMRADDVRVRQELLDDGELGDTYVPRMESVHIDNAARLRKLIAVHGWPHEAIAGKDGAEAAWLTVQHAIGEPEFQREMLRLLRGCAQAQQVPAWHAAYLEDRIAMYEGRPQRYGTQWLEDPLDGRIRPWTLAEPDRVNELRSEVGLGPLDPIPERGPELPFEARRKIAENQRWWEHWLTDKGWRNSLINVPE
jgi:hypothetical protein